MRVSTEAKNPATPPIVIQSHEWGELSAILQKYLPNHKVWAFGSRATGCRVKQYSDLDLAIEGEAMTLLKAALLDEALDESRLPFRVDVVELSHTTPEFRARIKPDLVLLHEPMQSRQTV